MEHDGAAAWARSISRARRAVGARGTASQGPLETTRGGEGCGGAAVFAYASMKSKVSGLLPCPRRLLRGQRPDKSGRFMTSASEPCDWASAATRRRRELGRRGKSSTRRRPAARTLDLSSFAPVGYTHRWSANGTHPPPSAASAQHPARPWRARKHTHTLHIAVASRPHERAPSPRPLSPPFPSPPLPKPGEGGRRHRRLRSWPAQRPRPGTRRRRPRRRRAGRRAHHGNVPAAARRRGRSCSTSPGGSPGAPARRPGRAPSWASPWRAASSWPRARGATAPLRRRRRWPGRGRGRTRGRGGRGGGRGGRQGADEEARRGAAAHREGAETAGRAQAGVVKAGCRDGSRAGCEAVCQAVCQAVFEFGCEFGCEAGCENWIACAEAGTRRTRRG